jgi:hypothetical protein
MDALIIWTLIHLSLSIFAVAFHLKHHQQIPQQTIGDLIEEYDAHHKTKVSS